MDRPASRGLLAGGVQKAPTGLAMERPERPSTAQHHQQQQGQPPATAMRPLGTASSRGGVLGPGTAFKRVLQPGGAQMHAASEAQARPLTQQGMGGLKPATQASGRQVLDRTYFVNELRQKRQQVFNITTQMRDELEVLEQKKAAASRAEKLASQLKKEVRVLQEALADNNIIIDKAGSQTPIHHIHEEFADIKARNETQQARVEDMLAQRLTVEQQTKQVEAQTASIQSTLDQRLGSMPPAARQAYNDLLAEQALLLGEAGRCEEEAAELGAALAAAEGELSRNGFKQRALEVQEHIRLLTQRKVELAAAEEASKAPAEEQREALMARIKRDNAAVEQLMADAKQLQGRVKQLESQQAAGTPLAVAATMPAAAAGSQEGDDLARRAKYEELRGKERELVTFIDAFPQRRAAKQAELTAKQEAIVALLQRLAQPPSGPEGRQSVAAGAAAPGAASPLTALQQSRLSLGAAVTVALAGGGSPGAGAAGTSAGSSAGRAAELAAKRAELQKLEGLEAKIGEELQALRERMSGMQAEVDTYADVEAARAAKEAARQELEQQQRELRQKRDAVKADLADGQWAQQTREAALKEQPAWPAIDRLEQQLKQVQGQCDKARQGIREHEEQSNYGPLLPQLAALVEGINAANIAAAVGA